MPISLVQFAGKKHAKAGADITQARDFRPGLRQNAMRPPVFFQVE